MAEFEWDRGTDVIPMLAAVRGRVSARKLQLFGCACCRCLVWDLLTDDRSRQAVVVAEQFADGLATREELEAASVAAGKAIAGVPQWTSASHATWAARVVAATDWSDEVMAVHAACSAFASGEPPAVGRERMSRAAELLRDVVGSPPLLQPAVVDPSALAWNGGVVRRLAQAAYDDRLPSGLLDNARLAVLADALEESGCNDAELLGHLRGPGPHVRGCHVLDALLDKR
jgi:hypothetical protein